jgi:CRISPR-associated exonuclease Cas4
METDDYVMLSALQHYIYCPRQCALIHIEQTFEENLLSARTTVKEYNFQCSSVV